MGPLPDGSPDPSHSDHPPKTRETPNESPGFFMNRPMDPEDETHGQTQPSQNSPRPRREAAESDLRSFMNTPRR